MDVYSTEDQQLEAIKNWWKKYSTLIMVLVIIGLLAGFGWRYWQRRNTRLTEQASVLYEQMISSGAQQKAEEFNQYATRLVTDYKDTTYADLAELMLVREAVNKGKLTIAQQKLQWVMQHAESQSLRQIARLRLARVLVAENKPAQALKVLQVVDNKQYMAAINEVKGDIFVSLNQKLKAKKAYQTALSELPKTAMIRSLVQMKLAQLENNS